MKNEDWLIEKAVALGNEEKKELENLLRKAGFENVPLLVEYIEKTSATLEEILQEHYFEVEPIARKLTEGKKKPTDKKIIKAVTGLAFAEAFRSKVGIKFNAVYDDFYKHFGDQYKSPALNSFQSKFTDEMRTWVHGLPDLMELTTGREVVRLINKSYNDNMGGEWLKIRLSELADFSHARARTTAITENLRMYSASQYEAMDKSDWVIGQEWAHLNGIGEPRLGHVMASGQRVKTGKPFTIEGEQARFPRDPNLSMWNSINCHCFVKPVTKGTE